MKITVAIATIGRPDILLQAVSELNCQTRAADRVIISAASPADVGHIADCAVPSEVLFGPPGLTCQRNTALKALHDEDIVLFLDDDFVMAPDYLAQLETLFANHAGVVAITGTVLADGIGNAGIDHASARMIIDSPASDSAELHDVNNGYGCNMAFRCKPIYAERLRFDEVLPLYGWLEDVDFSQRIAAHGRCVRAAELRGVHLGTKGGRTSGVRLGYSQVINPVYLTRKTTLRRPHAMRLIARNITANLVKCLRPEPWVDRRGRLQGNLMGLADVVRGRIDPGRILSLGKAIDGKS